MKALSVKNPWAWLICAGYKNIENRTWKTNFRGRILIHVPANPDKNWRNIYPAPQAMEFLYEFPNKKISNAIIGEVKIVNCVQDAKSIWAQKDCYHWILNDPILYEVPILGIKGKLGLWEYTSEKQGC